MTIQQKCDFIRQKAIETNPEIVELKMGCRFERLIGSLLIEGVVSHRNYAGNYLVLMHGQPATIKEKDIGTIRGRPVRLADTILALRRKREELMRFSERSLDDIETDLDAWSNLLEEREVENELEFLWYNWNLREDDLESQSEPTIDFIYSLLK